MAILDNSVVASLIEWIGRAELDLQNVLKVSRSTNPYSALYSLRSARDVVFTNTTDDDITAAGTFENSIRTVESSLVTTVNPFVGPACQALQRYTQDTADATFRSIFVRSNYSGVTNTLMDAFRSAWRKGNREELPIRLGGLAYSGSWAYTDDSNNDGIQIDSVLSLKVTTVPLKNIVVTLKLVNAGGTTTSVPVSVPSNSTIGTLITIGTGARFVKLSPAGDAITSALATGETAGSIGTPAFDLAVV